MKKSVLFLLIFVFSAFFISCGKQTVILPEREKIHYLQIYPNDFSRSNRIILRLEETEKGYAGYIIEPASLSNVSLRYENDIIVLKTDDLELQFGENSSDGILTVFRVVDRFFCNGISKTGDAFEMCGYHVETDPLSVPDRIKFVLSDGLYLRSFILSETTENEIERYSASTG